LSDQQEHAVRNDDRDQESQRIVRNLSDAERLSAEGVSDDWVRICAELVSEFQRLQQQFRDLESQLTRTESESSQDTLLL
jgi:hypothetical protein